MTLKQDFFGIAALACELLAACISFGFLLGYATPLAGAGLGLLGLLFAMIGLWKGNKNAKIYSLISMGLCLFVGFWVFGYMPRFFH